MSSPYFFLEELFQHWKCLDPSDVGLHDSLFSPRTLRQEIFVALRISF